MKLTEKNKLGEGISKAKGQPKFLEANGHQVPVREFRQSLIAWGRKHFRRYPWRVTTDPYQVLMAETMLHRTQVRQVLPIYQDFINLYPDAPTLVQARKEDLHELLYSLGLRWRIDLMAEMTSEIVNRFEGKIPTSKKELLTLPGVSDYIAGAVACFAGNNPEPILDTNTVRVIGRVFGLRVNDSSRRSNQFRTLATALLDPKRPREYNYALLDLADRICTKSHPPDCPHCPLLNLCLFGHRMFHEQASGAFDK